MPSPSRSENADASEQTSDDLSGLAGELADRFGIEGEALTVSTACAGGTSCSPSAEAHDRSARVLVREDVPLPDLKEGEVLIAIAGCGVCGTDLGYFYNGIPTVARPPLILGHEISGTVVAGDTAWLGREVIVPTIIPCRQCELCRAGRANRCLRQKMPGNSHGIYVASPLTFRFRLATCARCRGGMVRLWRNSRSSRTRWPLRIKRRSGAV